MTAINGFLNIIRIFGPLIFAMFGVIIAYNLIKSGKKMSEAVKGISESPGNFVFSIVVVVLMIYIFIKYILPLLDKVV